MKNIIIYLVTIVISTTVLNCSASTDDELKSKEVYRTSNLIITQISENLFVHISYKATEEFGYVACNGLVVRDENEVIVFDTPTNDTSADELITWLTDILHCKINAVIPTHFHDDCLGGLKSFHKNNIPSYANFKTIELAKENDLPVPNNGFKDSLILMVGNEIVAIKFFGEGHSRDNVIGYFPSEDVMFGGCLIKELNAGKGYLGDANEAAWSNTVEKVKEQYPNVKIVVPGHGYYGDSKLLDYTIKLFKP
jgi:metallo-beta-lactamase class B